MATLLLITTMSMTTRDIRVLHSEMPNIYFPLLALTDIPWRLSSYNLE